MNNNTIISSNQRPNGAVAPPAGPQQFIASDWKPFEKNTLRGFCTITLPSGLVIKDCSYHRYEDGRRWVSMPGKPYTGKNGAVTYTNILDFTSKEAKAKFQQMALEAVDGLLQQEGAA